MKYIFCCLVLVICITEASTIRSILSTKQNNKLKFSLDDLTTEEASSPYAYLEGKSNSDNSVVEEPRFLSKKQDPSTFTDPSALSNVPAISTPSLTTPVFVASSPPGMQLTRLPYVGPVDPIVANDISLEEDPEMAKLSAALEAVKEDLVGNSKQISDEKKWVGAVKAITFSYDDKMKRVNDHILALRKEQKKLFDKKKQIENLKLQKRLQSKLVAASEELKTLQNSLDHVQKKSHELNSEHSNLQTTIQKIEVQLTKLQGAEGGKHKRRSGKDGDFDGRREGGREGGGEHKQQREDVEHAEEDAGKPRAE